MGKVYYPQCRAILSVMFDGFGPPERDTDPFVIPVQPKTATIVRNSYRQADSWEITFDADDLPIDPRLVIAGQAEIYLYNKEFVTDDQRLINRQSFDTEGDPYDNRPSAAGPTQVGRLTGALETMRRERGAKARRERFTDGGAPTIVGLFDRHSASYSENGRWVTLSGQDYTAYLANRQWPPLPNGRARKIPVGKRLDQLLEDIIRDADPENKLKLSVENLDRETLPNVGPAETRANRRGIPIEQKTTYWDVITKLSRRYGCIAFVRGLEVVLTRPQNLSEDSVHRIRRMAFGKNVTALSLERKLGKETAPTIVVKSYDERTRKTITAEYPKRAWTKIKSKQRTGAGKEKGDRNIRKDDEYQIFPVFGITDEKVLLAAAKQYHTLLGKAERTVRFATNDLTDLVDNSMLDLAAGDALTLDFEEFNVDRALLANEKVSREAKVQHLVDRGFNTQVAAVLAEKYDELRQITRPLRVRESTYEYSDTDGIRIEAELVDFIVVDGIRDADSKESRVTRRDQLKEDGSVIGYTKDQEDAALRQYGGRGGS